MSLRRIGFTTFATMLLLGSVLLVLGPIVSSTLVLCPGPPQLSEYAVLGWQVWPPRVFYSNGCNSKMLDPSFAVAYLLALLGLVLAAVGFGWESVRSE